MAVARTLNRRAVALAAALVAGMAWAAAPVAWAEGIDTSPLAPAPAQGGGELAVPAAATGDVDPVAAVELLAAPDAVGPAAETVQLGLRIDLKDGWKTYWRSPGAAGRPPRLDWSDSASRNLAGADLAWPAPERLDLFGLQSFGWSGEVVLPITAELARPGEPLRAAGEAALYVCRAVCVPHTAEVAITLPARAEPAASPAANLIQRWRSRVPVAGEAAGIRLAEAVTGQHDGRPAVALTLTSETGFDDPDLALEVPGRSSFAAPRLAVRADGRRLAALLTADAMTEADSFAGDVFRVTVMDGVTAAELVGELPEPGDDAAIAEAAAALPAAGAGDGPGSGRGEAPRNLAVVLAIALLGGLILNVMPCVLPVLSLKLLSVVEAGGQPPSRVRANFLITAAGILAAFLVLAGVLIALRVGGATVGWGLQFQQPLFLAVMTVVVSAFAANLLGLFAIRLPASVGGALTATAARHGDSPVGHFLTGAFAMILATPCSAPFLGTAVSYALARGPGEILVVFLALGLGLAVPYLAVAAVPRAAHLLPRPGPWLRHVRRGLALALLATAGWLLTVLAGQVGSAAALAVAAALVAGGVGLMALRRPARRLRVAGAGVVTASLAAALLVPALVPRLAAEADAAAETGTAAATGAGGAIAWRAFAPAEIDAHVAAGRRVFVDITAAWCVTCAVNKRILAEPAIADTLNSDSVVAMRGDWTNPDPAIRDFLAAHGRYGIPFNAVYGPGLDEPVLLPELLTAEAVQDALARAASPAPLTGAGSPGSR